MQLSSGAFSLLALENTEVNKPVVKDYMSFPFASSDGEPFSSAIPYIKSYVNSHQLKSAKCCFVLDDKDYQIFSIDSPNVPDEEMHQAIKWKMKELIHVPINKVLIDFFLLPCGEFSAKKMINVVVVEKSLVNNISQMVCQCGLNLTAIDIPELSYRNYFENTEYYEKSIAVVLLKENYGKLIVIQKGTVVFSRSFIIRYNAGLFDVLPESEITLELQRSLDYCERQLKQVIPSAIILVGESISEDKITSVMRDSLHQPIVVGHFDKYEFTDQDILSSGRLLATYGAALRHGVGV